MGEQFSTKLQVAANWKHAYFGSAYSTRMQAAIRDARKTCDELEGWLRDNEEWVEKDMVRRDPTRQEIYKANPHLYT